MPHRYSRGTKPANFKTPAVPRKTGRNAVPPPAASYKNVKTLNVSELEDVRIYAIATEDPSLHIRVLEQMEVTVQDVQRLREVRLELCDAYFNEKLFDRAYQAYSQYAQFYPGDTYREYAEYKAILCSFYSTLEPDRDQTKTKNTVALIDTFLNRAEQKNSVNFVSEVAELKRTCFLKMAEHDLLVLDFYLKKKNTTAARGRIATINKEYPLIAHVLEPRILEREITIAQLTKDAPGMQRAKTRLASIQKNDMSKKQLLLTSSNPTKPYVNRF